jgi:penicillin-binding protein 1C
LWRRKPLLVLLAAVLAGAAAFWAMLPRPLFREPHSAVLFARDGSLLGARIAADGQWRFPDLDSVPQRFATALIAYEDRRFFEHVGVDPLAIARAARENWRAERVVSGASTLTMQLARLVRTQGGARPAARTLSGKAYEALLALRLELGWSKPELLALYASHAPFGGNVVGLEAASWRYFARAPEALSWAEAATLAVLPNSPALVTPGRNRERLREKRDQLLRRLARDGVLTPLDLDLALVEPLVEAPQALPDAAPHLLETLRRRYPDEYRFVTTLDAALQRDAMELVRQQSETLHRTGIGNAAAVIVDNQRFELLAYVGNSGWSTQGERSLAVDIVQRPRSTGSILKPFLYAAMLDSGQLLPQMLVADVPTQFRGFAPENFDRTYRGAVPADEALAESLNVPAVRMLREYGYPRFYDLLRTLGFTTLREPPDHYGLTLVLGGAEATLWDVTRAYANLADRARPATARSIAVNREIRILTSTHTDGAESQSPSATLPFSIGAAWLTQSALLEVRRPAAEAGWKEFASARSIAWKTGTSWGLRDGWAVGSSTRYTVGVWAGNATGTGVPGLTGSLAAAPLLFALHNRLPASPWYPEPLGALKRIEVCVDDGYLASELCESRETWAPSGSHFDRQSPYHRVVHTDATGRFRVDAACERIGSMRHEPWFVLPPAIDHYYRRHHSSYRPVPPVRADCAAGTESSSAMEFLYPGVSGKIYVPVELDGRKGRAVFEVVHRDPDADLYWHLDEQFAGRTSSVHQLAVSLAPGAHRVTVVDDAGNRLARSFEILDRETRDGAAP